MMRYVQHLTVKMLTWLQLLLLLALPCWPAAEWWWCSPVGLPAFDPVSEDPITFSYTCSITFLENDFV